LCHGLAGSIELLIDQYQITYASAALTRVDDLGQLLLAFSQRRNDQLVWCSDNPALATPDYMIGYAGVAMTLLRLSDAEHRPRQLSLAGYSYRESCSRYTDSPLT
jgi:lantibiotic modifying enzyme